MAFRERARTRKHFVIAPLIFGSPDFTHALHVCQSGFYACLTWFVSPDFTHALHGLSARILRMPYMVC